MTLVLSVQGRETIWLLADRRISYEDGRPPKDDARKIMLLEATDGDAILGYAGLGDTIAGTEPSDWMSAVLRGRKLPLEHYLGVLADASKQQLPTHLRTLPKGSRAHSIVAPAFVGNDVRLYTIDLALAPNGNEFYFRWTRHEQPNLHRPPTVARGGTGGHYLDRYTKKEWTRELLRLIKANEKGRASALAVADHMAKLNSYVYRSMSKKTVGPRCIVAWRNRKGGIHKMGGANQLYTGTKREQGSFEDFASSGIPTVSHGYDVEGIMRATMPQIMKQMMEGMATGKQIEIDKDAMNAALARLPTEPDEKLR